MATGDIVEVTFRNSYGRKMFEPRNDIAKQLAEFAKCKTFTEHQLQILKELGYLIEVKAEVPTV